ncbi:MAG: 50S ribosomal protein L25 [Parcubacteria group bacterium GW2011_GWB1_36_5]|nr:MAG: 50S ribosomal protein L25 [Parcubacteria group bacterium GW2011_GWA2_36_24]KKQ08130.1 MAG: 50S ribosomal protein L25 [Parcubacteria group bacterium GW2011_GWB1_36_5]
MFVIKADKRDLDVKLGILRKSGKIPAVFYGAGKTTTSVTLSNIEFKKIWREAGESSAIKILTLAGEVDALIHEVQVDPVTDEPIHVDFLVIDMKKKIQVKVPLIFEGVSNAVKNGIGNLVKVLHEIEIEALPIDLPQKLSVDISKLETLENNILVSDIKLPTGVVVITSGDDVVASIIAQVEEKEEVVAEPVDLSAIEVEKKGKKDLPEGEGEKVSVESTVSTKGIAPGKEEKPKAEKK